MSSLPLSLYDQVQRGVSKRADFQLVRSKTALLIIDVQTYCCDGGSDYYSKESLPQMVTNLQRLVEKFRSCRDCQFSSTLSSSKDATAINKSKVSNLEKFTENTGCEVIFTMIQAQTVDGRDLSLDYKLSGPYFSNCPTIQTPYSEIFLNSLQPMPTVGKGDIVIPKTSCSVFISTNLNYVLKNLHIEQLVVTGQLTEQCIESAVRDAADLGYFVTVVDDACATYSPERHNQGLSGMKGFCRIVSTDQIIQELEGKAE